MSVVLLPATVASVANCSPCISMLIWVTPCSSKGIPCIPTSFFPLGSLHCSLLPLALSQNSLDNMSLLHQQGHYWLTPLIFNHMIWKRWNAIISVLWYFSFATACFTYSTPSFLALSCPCTYGQFLHSYSIQIGTGLYLVLGGGRVFKVPTSSHLNSSRSILSSSSCIGSPLCLETATIGPRSSGHGQLQTLNQDWLSASMIPSQE